MVAINLLPDLRQAKNRDLHRRQLAIGLGTLAVVVSVVTVLAMYLILGGMKLQIHNLNNQISDRQKQLVSMKDLPQAITLQKHLADLPSLYSQRSSYGRYLFVLEAASPNQVQLTSLAEDTTGMMTIIGKTDSYTSIGKYAEALKADPSRQVFSLLDSNTSPPRNFSSVNITSAATESKGGVGFTIKATVSPSLLSGGGK